MHLTLLGNAGGPLAQEPAFLMGLAEVLIRIMGVVRGVVGFGMIGIIGPAGLQAQQIHGHQNIPVNVHRIGCIGRHLNGVDVVNASIGIGRFRYLYRLDIQSQVGDGDTVQHITRVSSHVDCKLLTRLHPHSVRCPGNIGHLITLDGHGLGGILSNQGGSTGKARTSPGVHLVLHHQSGSKLRFRRCLFLIQHDEDIHIGILHLKGKVPSDPGSTGTCGVKGICVPRGGSQHGTVDRFRLSCISIAGGKDGVSLLDVVDAVGPIVSGPGFHRHDLIHGNSRIKDRIVGRIDLQAARCPAYNILLQFGNQHIVRGCGGINRIIIRVHQMESQLMFGLGHVIGDKLHLHQHIAVGSRESINVIVLGVGGQVPHHTIGVRGIGHPSVVAGMGSLHLYGHHIVDLT